MKRLDLKQLALLSVGVILLSSCNGSSEGTPTTTASTSPPSIAAPTTALPSITVATTAPPTPAPTTAIVTTTPQTAPPTSAAAPTTIGGTPEEVAQAEVLQTLNAFWAEVDACFAAPNDCDIEAVINTYTNADPANEIVDWFDGWIVALRERNERSTKLDDNESTLANLQVDGAKAVTTECKVDRSVRVTDKDGQTEIVNDDVGYGRYDLIWERLADRWVIRDAIFGPVEPGTNDVCPF